MAKQQRSLLKRRKLVTLVLSTLHTNSTCETLVRLQQMGVARWMLSYSAYAGNSPASGT